MLQYGYIIVRERLAGLQRKRISVKLFNNKKACSKTKSLKNRPKILNNALEIINVFLNINTRLSKCNNKPT